MLEVAMELERIALKDEYFIERKLYPNVDFYSGITLKAMGFPVSMFTVLFAVARTVGWISQWKEMIEDPSRRSAVRASSTRAPRAATTCLSASAEPHALKAKAASPGGLFCFGGRLTGPRASSRATLDEARTRAQLWTGRARSPPHPRTLPRYVQKEPGIPQRHGRT
jgi:hypothetical protein